MNRPSVSPSLFASVLVVISLVALPAYGRQAKSSFSKATVARAWLVANGGAGEPAASLLVGLNGSVLELYDDFALIEIHKSDQAELERRGHEQAVLVEIHDDFDKIFLNGMTLDAREADGGVPGEQPDPPYAEDQQGTWIIQFIGPVRSTWLDAVKALGIVPVQYVTRHAYIVGASAPAVRAAATLPFVQWTSQMHRYLKPSPSSTAGVSTIIALEESTEQLWVELAQTSGTAEAVARLQALSVSGFESGLWSDQETRVQAVFRTSDFPVILSEPLVFGIALRPTVDLSDERAVLAVTNLVPSVGSAEPGLYKKWLSDLCPSCTNLQADGFYIGIADTGVDGGDRAASGTLDGEKPSSDLHRAELAKSRIVWGSSFAPTSFASNQTWTNCGTACPDTTGSKHDTHGHGTLVAGMAAGDPAATGGKDSGGFFLGFGVAPSAGLVVTKINPKEITSTQQPVQDVTSDARTTANPRAYWQNFSINQYDDASSSTDCSKFYDGAYSILSRDFDEAVRDGDLSAAGNQQITLTVSSGNIDQQQKQKFCGHINRTLTLPPATAKNVIAIGGGENVQPEGWLCKGTLADDHQNLAMNAKHGTAFAGWYKPDLIAVSTSVASLLTNDAMFLGALCSSPVAEPSLPEGYRALTGTSVAAPIGAGAAALASRRFSSNPAAATPALVKAMLVAGAKSMRGGIDRATLKRWRTGSFFVGDRVVPTAPNGHYYEVESVGSAGYGNATSPEPQWPTDGGTVTDGSGTTSILWRDKGLQSVGLAIGAFPNSQQGFGRLSLDDVLSEYPARAFINETHSLLVSQSWTAEYLVHDTTLPVRVALVWTDPPAMWEDGDTSPAPPLVNDLDLSIVVNQSGSCVGRYLGNAVGSSDQSVYYPCTGGVRDSLNNVEIARFFADSSRGDTRFTVKVDFTAGTSAQNFALVVWNAYAFSTVTPPPPAPSTFTAAGASSTQVALSWSASAGAASYELQRSSGPREPYVTIASPTSTSYTDSGLSAATTYLYRLRARNAAGVSEWLVDPGTTVAFTDPVLIAGSTRIEAAHIIELRQAIDSIRTAAGLSETAWTDDPLPTGTSIKAAHVAELRTALAEARAELGLPAIAFTDGTLTAGITVVRAVHLQQLRDGL